MASIAYITNHDMIEYHRLHGNSEMVFWRFSGKRKFQNFHHGDYLFFLTKGTEKGKEKEKGIVGYGRYVNDAYGSVKNIWKRYGTQCGFGSEEQFVQAIQKYQKSHAFPKQIYCLLLDHVMFFQEPIYLSELEKEISKQVESYIYLDHKDSDLSWKILKKGAEVGVDLWSTYVERREATIQNDADIITIQCAHEQYDEDLYTNYEKKKISAMVKPLLKQQQTDCGFLAGGENDFWMLEQKQVYFYIPCVLSIQAWKRSLLYAIAKSEIYQAALEAKGSSANITVIFDIENESAKHLCEQLHITYRTIEEKQ